MQNLSLTREPGRVGDTSPVRFRAGGFSPNRHADCRAILLVNNSRHFQFVSPLVFPSEPTPAVSWFWTVAARWALCCSGLRLRTQGVALGYRVWSLRDRNTVACEWPVRRRCMTRQPRATPWEIDSSDDSKRSNGPSLVNAFIVPAQSASLAVDDPRNATRGLRTRDPPAHHALFGRGGSRPRIVPPERPVYCGHSGRHGRIGQIGVPRCIKDGEGAMARTGNCGRFGRVSDRRNTCRATVHYPDLVAGRVALGGFPPRAPTDPYVDTLDHTVPQVMGSLLDV